MSLQLFMHRDFIFWSIKHLCSLTLTIILIVYTVSAPRLLIKYIHLQAEMISFKIFQDEPHVDVLNKMLLFFLLSVGDSFIIIFCRITLFHTNYNDKAKETVLRRPALWEQSS